MLNIALAGLGTVGTALVNALTQNAEYLAARAGRPITLVAVSARDKNKKRNCDLKNVAWVDEPAQLASLPNVHVVVELMGGADGAALALAQATLSNQKHLVTANKALLAKHGAVLAQLAHENDLGLLFEAAVAGGIPVIKTLREGLAGNKLTLIRGILNGTCNFILTKMREEKWNFDEALSAAQRLGYAEAEPSADIDGHDTANKLALLSALAFGGDPDVAGIHLSGIRHITPLDLQFADELGCRIKLLGVARNISGAVTQHVGAALVPVGSPLAQVDGPMNAVLLRGDQVGELSLVGQGAGGLPTASAVLGDLVDIARGAWNKGKIFVPVTRNTDTHATKQSRRYYLRLMALDQAGVVAEVAAILRDHAISIESLLQHGRASSQSVPVVITTHHTDDVAMQGATEKIAKLAFICETPCVLPIED